MTEMFTLGVQGSIAPVKADGSYIELGSGEDAADYVPVVRLTLGPSSMIVGPAEAKSFAVQVLEVVAMTEIRAQVTCLLMERGEDPVAFFSDLERVQREMRDRARRRLKG